MPLKNPENDRAVSEVVGEMLMIGIVLILIAVFTASLASYLPSERTPSVTILMSQDSGSNITLWHKGGDWVKASSLRVIIGNTTGMTTYTLDGDHPFILVPGTQAFDLESNITVIPNAAFAGDESVSLATGRAVIFSGRVRGAMP